MSDRISVDTDRHDDERPFHEVDMFPSQWPIDLISDPSIGIEDILAVQALIMTHIRSRARTRLTDPLHKRHAVCLLDTSVDPDDTDIYDGSMDTYLTCQIKKPLPDQWRMVVRFVTMLNYEEAKRVNTQEMYAFDWLRNGNRAAWYTRMRVENVETGSDRRLEQVHPITRDFCDDLQDRMLEHTQRANPLTTDSIYIPRAS